MKSHVDLVAWLHIALGVLGLLGAVAVFFMVAGAGLVSGDAEAIFVTSTVAVVVAAFLFLVSVPAIVAGVGLLKRAEWARILMLIVAFFELFHIPIGTLLAVYTYWTLLQEEAKWLFRSSPA